MRIKNTTFECEAIFIPFLEGLTGSLGDIIVFLEKLRIVKAVYFLSDHELSFS